MVKIKFNIQQQPKKNNAIQQAQRPAKPTLSSPPKLILPWKTQEALTPPIIAPVQDPTPVPVISIQPSTIEEDLSYRGIRTYDANGKEIPLDEDQRHGVDMAISGKSFCLTGNAGTGKTTANQAMMLGLLYHHAGIIHDVSYRLVNSNGLREIAPSIAVVAFANRAVDNMRIRLQSHPDLAQYVGANVTTIHNLLEYTVEFVTDEETGAKTMRTYPKRDAQNPLTITHLIVEEASMVGAGPNTIWEQLYNALPAGIQIIYLGDIDQVQPVGGKPILAYALYKLPIVQLRTVHRQALESPIVAQAYRCLRGQSLETQLLDDGRGVLILNGKAKDGRITRFSVTHMLEAIKRKIPELLDNGSYDPAQDIWICPYNKSSTKEQRSSNQRQVYGTIDLNAIIANELARRENRLVHELRTGFYSHYLSIGDRVFINKLEGVVLDIQPNPKYLGRTPKQASTTLDYYGIEHDPVLYNSEIAEIDYSGLSARLEQLTEDEAEERKNACSHIVKVLLDGEIFTTLSSSGDFDSQSFSLGYALTVHKSQGSEWRHGFFTMHDCHAALLCREVLYTAITRPKEALIILAQDHVLDKAIKNQRIKGNSLAAKIEYFAGYLDQDVPVTKPLSEVDEAIIAMQMENS